MPKVSCKEQGIEWNGSTYSWEDVEGIHFSFLFRHPFLQLKDGKKLSLPKDPKELEKFALPFYTIWKEKNSEKVKKNAFDYVEPPKSTAYLMFVISTLFFLPLAFLLFQESYAQYACTQALRKASQTSVAEILELKKKKKGNFLVRIRFQTVSGKEFTGERLTMKTYAPDKDPQLFSVTYAKSAPHCWVLNEDIVFPKINWIYREYNTLFNFLVGLVFFVVGALGSISVLKRLQEKRSNTQPIKDLFSLDV